MVDNKHGGNMPETSLMIYDRLSDECRDIFARKNSDYGDSFREDVVLGVLIRMKDKLNRAISLCRKVGEAAMVEDESLRDTLLDYSNYGKMGVICIETMNQGDK